MYYPTTKHELLDQVAIETARLSYPGGMSRGVKQVVTAGTKAKVEEYFVTGFPINALFDNASDIVNTYDGWHEQQGGAIPKIC